MSSTQWYNGSLSCSPVGRTTLITSLLTNSSVQSTQMARVCISTFWIPIKQKLLIVFVIIRNKIRTHSYSYWKSHGLWVSRSQITTHFGITRCEYHLFLWLIWLLSMRGGGNRPDGNNSWWSTHNIKYTHCVLKCMMLYTHCVFNCTILSSRETTSWRWSHILPHSVRSAHMTEQYNNNDKHMDRNIVKTNNERILMRTKQWETPIWWYGI